jgi:hypothetical protein
MGELGGRVGVFPALAFSGVVSLVLGLVLLLLAFLVNLVLTALQQRRTR